MNRLHTRLAIAMTAIAILTVLIITAGQQLAFRVDFLSLPPEVQQRILERREREENASDTIAINFRRSQRIQQQFLFAGTVFAALLASIMAIFYARNISKPIERVSSASAKVSKGDLSVRVAEQPIYSSHEAKSLTDNFNQMAAALETYETGRRDMIASIAHDLRTPLTALKLRLEALKEELVPLNQNEIALLLSQTDLLEQLITDLRTLSLADAGKLTLNKQETNLYRLLHSVIEIYEQIPDTKRINIELAGDELASAYIDRTRFKQIASNLLDNAIRLSPDGGDISITLKQGKDKIKMAFKDDGPGIPEKLLPVIFERYVKDKDTGGSSGLGLAIVQTLISLHDGSVRAFNHPEGGAVFEIILPT